MDIKKIAEYIGVSENIITDIQHYYNEPHRSYHSWNHIIQGIKDFKSIEDSKIFNISMDMKIAWLFHDIIYLPFNINTGVSNEELSIKFLEFYNTTKMKLPLNLIEESKKLIKATEEHNSFDEKSAIFLDVDMSYLGAEYNLFLKIREKVRQEYSNYSDIDFAKGTINFYKTMLRKNNIFQSNYGIEKFEEFARNNMLLDLKNQEKVLSLVKKSPKI